MELVSSVEDHFVRWDALISHGGCHVTSWAVNDKVTEERLALPESAVEGFGWVELIQAVEEMLLSIREQLLEVCCCALGGQDALVAEGESFVALAVDQ